MCTVFRIPALLFAIILAGLPGLAVAQDALERDPGYVDFQTIDKWFDREAKIEVNVKGAMLRLVAEASREEDPEFARLVWRLRAINVRGYELTNSNMGAIERNSTELGRRMQTLGWETLARVREDDQRTAVYLRSKGDVVSGMFVVVIDPEENEAIFVNIVGDIDPAEVGRIGSRFHIDALEGHSFNR